MHSLIAPPPRGQSVEDAPTLAEQAYRALRGQLLRCEIDPGEKLKIDALQRMLGISSSPLREALNRLVTEGLVINDERRGFAAAPVSIMDMRDVTRLRLMLDSEALVESMRLGDDRWEAEIVSIQHSLARIESRSDGSPLALNSEWSDRHKAFHIALLSATTSPKLLHMCSGLFDQAERYRRLSMRFRKEPRHKAAEHRRIMEAVIARKEKQALDLLTDHITRTASNVQEAMSKAELARGKSGRVAPKPD